MSECPPTYLVSAWIETSQPCAKGWKVWMPQVLSIMDIAPCARATAVSAGTSCTSNVWLPGLSRYRTFVFGVHSASRLAASIAGS